jgi:NitT/TauT family transport system permease protein
MKMSRTFERWSPLALAAVLLLLWQGVVTLFAIPDFIFPSPWQIAQSFAEFSGPILEAAWKTFWVTMLGFAVAIVVGVLLGFLVGSSRLVYSALFPLLVAFNAVPKAAVVPILVVWFGIGLGPGILTAFLISFFPITVNIATGLATLEPELEDVLRVLGAKRWDVLVKVGLPRSMPYFYGSLKIAITLAFSGIGYLMQSAGSQQRLPLAFAGLVTIGVMAMAMYELFSWVEKRTTAWAHRGSQAH